MSHDLERERRAILDDVDSSDEEMRRLAVERLLALPSVESIPLLVDCLGDESWRVRKAAVGRLVACSEAEAVAEALIGALADGENPGRRNSAVEALVALGPTGTPQLVAALASDDVDVRKLVVDALAGLGDESARDAMIETLGDADPNVRAAAADALGVVGGEPAVRALSAAAVAEGEDQLVRFSALRALARLEHAIPPDQLECVLADPVLRSGGLALLGYCDEDSQAEPTLLKHLSAASQASREAAIAALLCQLSRRDGASAERLAARVRETVEGVPDVVELVIERLAEAELTTRLLLVQFLGLVGSPRCVVPILESTRDEAMAEVARATLESLGETAESALDAAWGELDAELRRSACLLLARTRGVSGSVRLGESLDDPDAELRALAARALGARQAPGVLPALVRRLEAAAADEEPEARDELEAVMDAIAAGVEGRPSSADETVDLLQDALRHSHEPVRRAAVGVLARIARPEDADRMTQLLKDPSAAVRRLAVQGLTRLDSEDAARSLRLALADESPLVRMAAAGALGASRRDDVIDDLERLLVDEDPRVCAAAVRAIGDHAGACGNGDREKRGRALALLARAIAGPGRDARVAMAGIEALDSVGGPEAASEAARALACPEPEVVQAAVACVGRHADERVLQDLIPAVGHPSWSVRGEAIQTLAERRVLRALPAILRRLEIEQDDFVRDVIMRAVRRLEE